MKKIFYTVLLTAVLSQHAMANNCAEVYRDHANKLSLGVIPASIGAGGTAAYISLSTQAGSATILYGTVGAMGVAMSGLLGRQARILNLAELIAVAEGSQASSEKSEKVLQKLTRKVRRHTSLENVTEADVLNVLTQTSASGELCPDNKVMGFSKMKRFIARYLDEHP